MELKIELFWWHKSFGFLILILSLARLGWRIAHPAPALPASMAPWEVLVTKIVHWGFYVLLIAVPLFGWALVSSHPNRSGLEFFGMPWPFLPFFENGGNTEDAHELYEELHEIGAKVMIGLIVLHVGAALKHQFVNRDTVLARMMPMLRKQG